MNPILRNITLVTCSLVTAILIQATLSTRINIPTPMPAATSFSAPIIMLIAVTFGIEEEQGGRK